jgi:teichuronic acid exporter
MAHNQVNVLLSVGWLILSRGLTIPFNLVNLIVLARLLSPADFGLIALLVMCASLSAIFTEHGIVVPAIRAVELRPSDLTLVWIQSILVGSIATLIVVVMAPFLALHLGTPGVAGPLQVGALSIFLRSLGVAGSALLQRGGRFKVIAIGNTVSYCLGYTPVVLTLAVAGNGIWAIAIAYVAQAAIEFGWTVFHSSVPKLVSASYPRWRELVGSGVLPTVNGLANWAALNGSNMVVAAHLGIVQLGYFNRANTIYTIALDLFSSPTSKVLFPTLAALHTDRARLARAVTKALGLCLPLFSVGAASVALHAHLVIDVLLGPKWASSSAALALLFIGFPARAGYKIIEAAALATGHFRDAIYRQVVYAALVLVLVTSAASYGLVGVASAITISVWIYFFVSVLSLGKAKISRSAVLRTLGSAALFVLVYTGTDRLAFTILAGDSIGDHFVSIVIALSATTLFLMLGPAVFIGKALWEFRSNARSWLRNRLERLK